MEQNKSPILIGAITVTLTSFFPGTIYGFVDAFFSNEPHWKFGREELFKLSLFVSFWLTFCNLVAFLLTIPLYYLWQLKRSKGRIIIHSVIGTVLACASFYSGLPTRLEILLPHGTPSSNGITEIIILVAGTAIAPFFSAIIIHLLIDRLRSSQKTD